MSEKQEESVGPPTQKTPKGLEIPVRKRSEIMDAFRKIVRPDKPKG